MDDYGNQIDTMKVWKQFVGFACGEFSFWEADYWPLWAEQIQ